MIASGQRLLSVACVWLTAISTLLASFPRFECECPNGQKKVICLGFLTSSGCCCGGNSGCGTGPCCGGGTSSPLPDAAESTESPESTKSLPKCHCHQDNESNVTSGENTSPPREIANKKQKKESTGPQFDGPSCQKHLVPPTLVSFDPADDVQADELKAEAVLFSLSASEFAEEPCQVREWSICSIPPPTDLVISLLHLII